MSLDILKVRIKENKLSGVYLFCGQEEYTKDHYAARVRKIAESSPLPEFNHVYFNAASGKFSDFEDAVFSLPFMSENKLIEITDLESAKLTMDVIEDYARVFSDIPEYLTILMVLRADEQTEEARKASNAKNGLGALVSVVKDHGLVVEFENEKSDKLATWISKHFASKGIAFDANVPREIINVCGNDMYILQGEIIKLSEVFTDKPISIADVRKYCCANSSYKYFDMASALVRRDIVGAKRIWESLDLKREEISLAVGYLARKYAEMLVVKTGIDSGKSQELIAKDLGMGPKQKWQVQKIAASVGAVDSKMLSYAISQLSQADIKLKSYRGNPDRILELAFYRICTYGRKA